MDHTISLSCHLTPVNPDQTTTANLSLLSSGAKQCFGWGFGELAIARVFRFVSLVEVRIKVFGLSY